MSSFSVIIADDHVLVRNSIRQMLETSPDFEIVGEAEDGLSTVALVKSKKPDLVILDIAMPQATGVEAIEEVRRWSPETKIAVLTGMTSKKLLRHIFDTGVEGIFLKSEDMDEWLEDLKAICNGAHIIPEPVQKRIDEARETTHLTRRERQVLFAVVRCETNAIIAERLNISVNTVDGHRTKLMRKLGVHSAAELVAQAFRDGLLESDDHS